MTKNSPQTILRAFLDNPHPTVEQATEVFLPLTQGEYTEVEIAALLVAIRTRGETFQDIAGAAKAFLDAGKPFPVTGAGLTDAAGTGGDGSNSINISTAASLIAAAGGVKMVKHGNRSVSSKSGSADVLEALGIPLDLTPEQALRQLEESNFTFLFAPAYNPAIAHVQPVRKQLGISTLFNTMGPLLSPSRPEFQLMGVANPQQGEMIIKALKELGRSRALVVHGSGIDEIAVHGATEFWELKDGKITHERADTTELGVSAHELADLRGGDAQLNAQLIRDVFNGEGKQAHTDAIAVNAGALFYLNGMSETIAAGTKRAKELLDAGTVAQWLQAQEGANYGQ